MKQESTVPTCRDCDDLRRAVLAVRVVGKRPVCEEHFRQRMGQPNSGTFSNSGKSRGATN
jgi:hypothetical protein